jgi:hypothetical protein
MRGRQVWTGLRPSNKGLQADGGTAVVRGAVVLSPVGGSAAPAAEPWALAAKDQQGDVLTA